MGTSQIKDNAVTSVKVLNGSLVAQDFKPGQAPKAPSALSKVTIRSGPPATIPANASAFVQARCAGKERALGGGATNASASGVYLKQSYPEANGWTATYQNATVTSAPNVRAYAVCAAP